MNTQSTPEKKFCDICDYPLVGKFKGDKNICVCNYARQSRSAGQEKETKPTELEEIRNNMLNCLHERLDISVNGQYAKCKDCGVLRTQINGNCEPLLKLQETKTSETVEEAAILFVNNFNEYGDKRMPLELCFISGANWSKDKIINILLHHNDNYGITDIEELLAKIKEL